jgi:glutamyl-tRNA reductase
VIVVVGLSHREAPLEVRERLAVDKDGVSELLRALLDGPAVAEALCVSTCNRMEIYAVSKTGDATAATREVGRVLDDLARRNGVPGIAPHLKTHVGGEAVRHLFRVASSLDSLVVGEPQILGQVKDAFDVAKDAGGVGKFLERAMNRALHVAKRVRTETAIGEGQVSISSAAVDLAKQIFGDLSGRVAMLVGAGEMAEAAAKLLVKTGAKLLVVNRSPQRASELAEEFGGSAMAWADLPTALVKADVVVTSTSAHGFVVSRSMTMQAMKARKGRSLFFIDIAVPRDVEPSVNDLDNVYVYDIDNLSNVVAETMRDRQSEAGRAEALVDHEASNFESWAEARNLTGTIVALRAKVRASLTAELEKSLSGRLKHLNETDRKALETMLEAATNKLLHAPTSRIKALAGDPQGDDLVKALHHLFDLEEMVRQVDDAAKPQLAADLVGAPAAVVEPAAPKKALGG